MLSKHQSVDFRTLASASLEINVVSDMSKMSARIKLVTKRLVQLDILRNVNILPRKMQVWSPFSHNHNPSSSKSETNKLKDLIEEKEKKLDEVKMEVTNTKKELLETKEKLDQSQAINEKLIRDIQVLNSKMMELVPGAIERDIEEKN